MRARASTSAGCAGTSSTTAISNPAQVEDAAYLTGQPEAGPNQVYFGEFVLVKNGGSDPKPLPDRNDFRITDTTITDVTKGYEPLQSNSPVHLPLRRHDQGDSTGSQPRLGGGPGGRPRA